MVTLTSPARPVAIVGGVRLPFARSFRAYQELSNADLLRAAMTALVARFDLRGQVLGEVAGGAVLKHPRDWNLAREATLASGLSPRTPAYDIQRACGTSLSAALQIARRIGAGEIECGVAAGADTMSAVPLTLSTRLARTVVRSRRARALRERIAPWLALRPRDFVPDAPGIVEPRTGKSMGQHAQDMARAWDIGREAQDALALASHRRAAQAWDSGFFADLVVPHAGLTRDDNVRGDASMASLARLPPAFDGGPDATLTAGNSTPLSDGAAAVLLASEAWAHERGLPVLARLTHGAESAVDYAGLEGPPEGLLMAPAYAVPALLDAAGIGLGDLDVAEIHEAFAAQVLCTLSAWASDAFCRERLQRGAPLGALPMERLNPNGGSIAIGHPFAATGARLLATLAHALDAGQHRRGLVSICTAGGMGVAALLER